MSDVIEVRLNTIHFAARNTSIYEFGRPDGSPLPPAEAGAHLDLLLPNGLTRQYSLIVPDPSPTSYRLGVKRDPASRGGSKYVFDELRVGHLVKISSPRNNFSLVEDADHVVLIAGGIGITPIHAMVHRLNQLGRQYELHYSCRSRLDMAFFDEFKSLSQVNFHFDSEADGKFLDLDAIVALAPANAHLYCCGPTAMLTAFEGATRDRLPEQVHVEYFTAKTAANLEGGFIVELARSGKEFVIPPGKGILEVLRNAGFDLPYSCEQGVCGTCETAVISGIPDHRDSILSNSERAANKTMMICCGGSMSERLVLDI